MRTKSEHKHAGLPHCVGADEARRSTRRRFLFALGGSAFTGPLRAIAQQQRKVSRIGFLYNGSRQSAMETGRYPAFLQGMRDLGYVEGKNFVVEARFAAEAEISRMPALALELVRSQVDVIVCTGGTSGQALKQTTSTIPVVITVTNDPVREGFAASLARPGGNFTGLAAFLGDVFPKHIEMLRLVVPKLARIAVLIHSRNPGHPHLLKAVEAVAQHNGIHTSRIDVSTLEDMERGIAAAMRQREQALIILGDAFFVQYFRQIAGFAIDSRIPSIYSGREYPEAGGLMSYGPNFSDNFRRAATYVDKILKGTKAGELPIEQPTKFDLVVNRKTANALGISFSEELLFRVDKVIE
jgi:putative tryptophan/tyrosine transport system substrate-binding protein